MTEECFLFFVGGSFRLKPQVVSLNKENLQKHLSRSSSKDEISESKQMLFNMHLGQETSAAQENISADFVDYMEQLKGMGNAAALCHEPSQDRISSNYPNSSFSTFRENTFSSFSSMAAMAAAQENSMNRQSTVDQEAEDPESATNSSIKETVDSSSEAKEDVKLTQDEVEQSPVKEVEEEKKTKEADKPVEEEEEQVKESVDHKRPMKAWGQSNVSNVERKFMLQQKRMQEYFRQKDTDKWQASLSTETDMSSICNQCKEDEISEPLKGEIVKPPTPKRREKTPEKLIKSEIAKELEPKKLVIPMQEILKRPAPRPVTAPIFKRPSFIRDKDSVASSVQSHVSGVYTNEYLTRARKFGAVVGALRKPGHHIGPAKNPDCICEHCTRWFEEKCKGRGRANSITNAPLTFEGFRVRRMQQ